MNTKERLLHYLKPQKKLIIFSAISVLIYLIAQLMLPYLVGKSINSFGEMVTINNITHFEVNIDLKAILIYLSIALVLCILGVIFDFIFEYSVNIISQNMVKEIRDEVYQKLNSVPIKTIDNMASGDLVQLEIGDVENIANGLLSVFKQLLQGALAIIITIILMFIVNWILAIGVILLTPLSFFASKFVATFSHKHFKKQAKLMSELNALSLEAISDSELVQSLGFEDKSYQEFTKRDENLRKEGKVAQFSASWVNPSTRFVNNTIYAIIGIAGIIMILFTPSYPLLAMDIGSLTSFLSYTTEYTKPFNEISSVMAEFETAQFSFNRINDFLNREDDKDEGKIVLNEPIEDISFNHLFFSYEPNQHLIEDFNQVIHKHERVAIVGPTGAGKTTLINVLMRFYDPVSGDVTYNGIKGTDITKKSLRSNFGMVLQDTWIFSGTILENVRYAKPEATDAEVINACKRAHADSFINTLPDGYNTYVSAKGGLSEGERQLLTIARVMLVKPAIIILDEATSNIDTRTEKQISDAFDKMMNETTSIVIAHRLSTIQNASLILVLKDGNIIERGDHKSLMQAHGFYYELYSSQFK